MKILAIRIKNLASLEGTTEIDFTKEPLSNAGIFAITGPTGAGKSTILDALCLALYAQTPRYNKSSDPNQSIQDISGNTITQSDPRKILRDGATDGYAEVDFVGVDGNRYSAQWNVRRARNKTDGALQPYQIQCKNLDTNADVQGTKTEVQNSIVQKVGLSFEQFTRAVLLAQGDFTAFLKAPNNEKADLLEKLTGTQVYSEISKRIFEHHRIEKEELTLLNVQKEGISILNEEELERLNKRNTELIQLLLDQQNNVETLAKELAWHEKLQTLQQAFNDAGQTLEMAIAKKNAATERELKLDQVEKVQPIRVWVQGLTDQQKLFADKEIKHKDFEAALLVLEEQLEKQNEILNMARQNLDLKTKEQEQAQPLLNKAKQLDTQLQDRLKQMETAKTELQQAKNIFIAQEKQIQKHQLQAEQLQQTIKKLEAYATQHQNRKSLAENDQLVLTSLAEALSILQEEQRSLKDIKEAQQLLEGKQAEEKTQIERLACAKEAEQTLAEVYIQLQKNISVTDSTALQRSKKEVDTQVIETIQAIADWRTLFESTSLYEKNKISLEANKKEQEANQKKLDDAAKEVETSLTRKEAAYRSLEIAQQESTENVVNLRQQLKSGDPCLVCGSTEHPYAIHDPRLDNILTKLEADFKQQELKYRDALMMHTTLQEKQKQLEKEFSSLSSEQLLQEQRIKEYRENWIRFSLHTEAEKHPIEEISVWLKQKLSIYKNQQNKLQQDYDFWQQQQRELEEHKNKHEKAKEHYRVTEDALKDLRRTIESQQEKMEQAKKEQNKAEQKLTQTKVDLVSYFSNKDWFEYWKKDADAFTKQIGQFSTEWKVNMESLDKNRQEQLVLAATITGEENKQQLLADEVSKKENVTSESTQQYHTLLDERKQLFEG